MQLWLSFSLHLGLIRYQSWFIGLIISGNGDDARLEVIPTDMGMGQYETFFRKRGTVGLRVIRTLYHRHTPSLDPLRDDACFLGI